MTVEVSTELLQRLEAFAELTEQDLAHLVNDALTEYLAVQDWHGEAIRASLAEIDAGAKLIPHEAVVAWIESWDTPNELPPPS